MFDRNTQNITSTPKLLSSASIALISLFTNSVLVQSATANEINSSTTSVTKVDRIHPASSSNTKSSSVFSDGFSFKTIEGTTPEELLEDFGFEQGINFLDLASTRGTAERSSDNVISGNYSLDIALGSYGKALAPHYYPYGADIYSKALHVYARANIPEGNHPEALLKFCAVAYYFDNERVDNCQDVPGSYTGEVTADVVLELDPTRKVSRVFNWIQSVEHGPFKATVDDLHLVMYRTGENNEDTPQDTDGDGINDELDAFPNDASETVDTDGDGVGDNGDAFPTDASETKDTDGDGVGDNTDVFPNDANETVDTDGDGVGDNGDAFPTDASETKDTDGDGVGDNTDAFPNDANETIDTDGDGVGDNGDAFPSDATESKDSDSDGVGDNADVFPNDPTETKDSDGDGIGDNADDDFVLLNLVDTTPEELVSDTGFEQGIDFLDLASTRGTAERSSDDVISGNYSLDIVLGNYGKARASHYYPYGADIYSKALHVYARANIPEGNNPEALLKFCAVAYYFDKERVDSCQDIPATQTGEVTADVVLELDPTRKVSSVFNWIQSGQHGPFKATVDDMHLVMYRTGVVADEGVDDETGNDSEADVTPEDGSGSNSDPTAGDDSGTETPTNPGQGAPTPNLTKLEDWQKERLSEIPESIDRGIFVSNEGSDANGDGTINNPYKTINHALSVADAGETLTIRGGTYHEAVRIRKPNITLRSKTGERAQIVQPVFEGGRSTIEIDFEADGTTIQGLEVVGGHYYGIMVKTAFGYHNGPLETRMGAENVTIEDSIIHDTGRDGIKLTPQSDYAVIRRNEIYNTGLRTPHNADGIDNVNSDYVLIQDNYIHDVATNGLYCKGGAKQCVVERNKVERAGAGGILVGFDTSIQYFDNVGNPKHYENFDGIVRNNLIIDTQTSGIGIYSAVNAVVANNTIVNAAQTYYNPIHFGLVLQDYAVSNDPNDGIDYRPASVNPVVINNIVVQPASFNRPTIGIRSAYHGSLGRYSALEGMPYLNNNIYYQDGGSFSFRDERPESRADGDFAQWTLHIQNDYNSIRQNPLLDEDYLPAENSVALGTGLITDYVSYDLDGEFYRDGNDIGSRARNLTDGAQ